MTVDDHAYCDDCRQHSAECWCPVDPGDCTTPDDHPGIPACIAGRELRGTAVLRRRALVTLTPGLLAAMLRLPEGVCIVGADYDSTKTMIRLTVEGEPLPSVEEGYALSDVGGDATFYRLDHGGHLWTRAEWEWGLPGDA